MKRNQLLGLLMDYRGRWCGEEAMVTRMIQFVTDHPDCFERSLTAGHVTGSAWVVDDTGTRVLLTHHRKLNRWLQPGGHADGDPDALRVALREVREETGLDAIPAIEGLFDVDIHLIPARKHEPAHYHYDARFALRVDHADPLVISDESHDLRWVPLSELGEYTDDESMHRMAAKWRSLQKVES